MNLTKKQHWIMEVIMKGKIDENGEKRWLDIYDLVEDLPYETTRDSLHFSLRPLIEKGLIEKGPGRKGKARRRTAFIPTDLAFDELVKVQNVKTMEYDGIVETY